MALAATSAKKHQQTTTKKKVKLMPLFSYRFSGQATKPKRKQIGTVCFYTATSG